MLHADANESGRRSPWFWIPTLYLAEGLPNAMVTTVSIVLYKELGVPNSRIGVYTGLFYLPWAIKPLWSPVVDLLGTRRRWIWQTQLLLAAGLAGLALALPTTWFVPCSIACFFLVALSSATHDIAADGFYILALSEAQQSFFSGVRNTVYRAAALLASGPLVLLAAAIEKRTHDVRAAWAIAFAVVAALFAAVGPYHRAVLPRPVTDRPRETSRTIFLKESLETFGAFFRKPNLAALLSFLLLYRFAEAQLLPMAKAFLLDTRAKGGLELTQDQFGIVYGTIGVIALMVGGIVGGILVSRHGLRVWLWPMVFVMHVPDAVFVYLAHAQPTDLTWIGAGVALEQFGYGFGFTAYMLYMIHIARGPHATAHYAICTGFMALGLMLAGSCSGLLQRELGYRQFFVWVMLATIPGFIVTALIPLEAAFGKKR